jgi:hypothetical protein
LRVRSTGRTPGRRRRPRRGPPIYRTQSIRTRIHRRQPYRCWSGSISRELIAVTASPAGCDASPGCDAAEDESFAIGSATMPYRPAGTSWSPARRSASCAASRPGPPADPGRQRTRAPADPAGRPGAPADPGRRQTRAPVVFIASKNALWAAATGCIFLRQGGRTASGTLPRRGGRPGRHPRQHRQSGRDPSRRADLEIRMVSSGLLFAGTYARGRLKPPDRPAPEPDRPGGPAWASRRAARCPREYRRAPSRCPGSPRVTPSRPRAR